MSGMMTIPPAAPRPAPAVAPGQPAPPILNASPGFLGWLAEQRVGFVLSTYQAGRLVFIGRRPDGSLRGHERLVEQCQGLWTDGETLLAGGKTMLWRFRNALPPGMGTATGADRLFVPREGRVTGALDIHDIGFGQWGGMAAPGPVFVATQFNCLATTSEVAGFRPLWRPPFVSALVAEDRCHLNGLAMDGDAPAYVTAVSETDTPDGWRAKRRGGGVVVHVPSGAVVGRGLSMPHSPRLQDGRLWLLNSGRGELGWLDPRSGIFTAVAFCPGFARGLVMLGRYAVVGLSRPRNNLVFEGLDLEDALRDRNLPAQCGLLVVDTVTGERLHTLRFAHTIEELYDVAALRGVVQAEAVGFRPEDLERQAQPEL